VRQSGALRLADAHRNDSDIAGFPLDSAAVHSFAAFDD
jgi:hypothetical protein